MAATRRPSNPARTPTATPEPAYVLHQYDWSESSLILDVFTRDQGRLVLVAKGAKRPYSQLRPVLMPFQRILVTVGRASRSDTEPREVQTLRAAEWAGGSATPAGPALFSGFYLNELLVRLTARHDPHPLLFDAYALTLAQLAGRLEDASALLRAFELVLLREIGLLPDLSVEAASLHAVEPGRRYELRPELGLVERVGRLPDPAASIEGELALRLHAALGGRDFDALVDACAQGAGALKAALRELLHYHLGSNELRSRDVLHGVQGLSRRAAAA